MKFENVFDLIVWLLIAVVGLVAAYVCFGLLKSTADGTFNSYSVGGAIAGALVSWGVLTSVYLQLRSSTGELQDLRKRSEELQSKLIRGAPRPGGFEIEVAERQRIVLARPRHWRPKGGTIFELEMPGESMTEGDCFPATFRCYFAPIESGSTPSRDKYYESELKAIKDASGEDDASFDSYSTEIVRIGGELSAVDSLKIIMRHFLRIDIGPSLDTGKIEREWWMIGRSEFAGRIYASDVHSVTMGRPVEINLWGTGFREGAVCYVNGMKRDTKVRDGDSAQVTLLEEDVRHPGTVEFVVENPGTGGIKSNAFKLPVIYLADAAAPGLLTSLASAHDETKTEADADTSISTAIKTADHTEDSGRPTKEAPETSPTPIEKDKDQEKRVVYEQVSRMRVICYHEQLATIFFFDFWDNEADFVKSSTVFNQILASTRFLD